jgi:hypothetical protein
VWDGVNIGGPPGCGDGHLGQELGRQMRQELKDTSLALGGETGPDLDGWDGISVLRDP